MLHINCRNWVSLTPTSRAASRIGGEAAIAREAEG